MWQPGHGSERRAEAGEHGQRQREQQCDGPPELARASLVAASSLSFDHECEVATVSPVL